MKRFALDAMLNAGMLLVYYLAAKVGLSLAVVDEAATAVWPPTGIALTVALLLGRRIWPGIWAGAFLANYSIGPALASAGIATGNLLEAIVGAGLINQFAGGKNAFDRAGDIFRFVLYAGFIATAVSATIGTSVLELANLATWENYGPIWMTWWLGDMVSAVTVAPLLIIWIAKPPPRMAGVGEAIALLIVTVIAALVVFGPNTPPRTPIGYFAIIPLLWAAFRYHQHGAVTAFSVIALVAIWGTLHGNGPFAATDRHISLLFLQSFLATISVMALVLSASVAERQTARREAEQANQAKDKFLAVLSHELRTPLTPVLLTVSLLERHEELSDEVKQDVQTIRRNIELEARLIDDLLDLTRIARGKMRLNMETADLHGVVRGALAICMDGRPNVNVDLSAHDCFVRGDPARLQQVFWNLLSNAQKFTPAELAISIRSTNPAPGQIRVEVRDSGIGIEPEMLPKLFTAFEQGGVKTTGQFGGLGLGLAISKAFVTAHGGTVSATSEGKGKGATFTVDLSTITQPVTDSRR